MIDLATSSFEIVELPVTELTQPDILLTSIKNPQANAVLEHVHQVLMTMLHTAELDMAKTRS